ncbi:PREDICTED: rho-related GTP-binding protein RhoE-like [Priapulus caudatus]|uniref:Rho-related GTP-binding protein RhoE-like n=1 Tax=Priapulus caudatus TaxID=37621 RepID=A0ABM1DQV0_PRICU|nr:PREDICTED: rho-related GTP-binding protein RhoE-like [Priapulus caudatus]
MHLRNDINTISELAKKRKITVTYEQETQISKQIGAKIYIETSARISEASMKEAFDVAVLAAIGNYRTGAVSYRDNATW